MQKDYRGLTADNIWEYGGINERRTMIVKGFTFLPVIPETIGKNTYCLDIVGKSAFEGDIVSVISGLLYVVEYNPTHAGFVLTANNESIGMVEGHFEIVGNIHQNPEILQPMKM